jgi:hypothetical protein
MARDQDITVEFVVPKDIAKLVEASPNITVQSTQEVEDDELRFGIVETLAILAVAKGVLSVTKTAIEIYNLLKKSGKPDAKAYLRSPEGRETVEISASEREEDVKGAVEEAYADE